jgi:low affinity Fe/Cu permease
MVFMMVERRSTWKSHSPGLTDFAKWIAEAAGHPISFSFALLTIIVWGASGPLF